ncbi:MAG TPA: hypothetical protein VMT15_20060 [Bryobacteraceae bacterium]|nr:hypothetical protein [Bryobacteraceae bacterium]
MAEKQETTALDLPCPKCGSHDIRRSKSEGFYALIQKRLGRWPFRCRSCRSRFYRSADPPPNLDE